MVFITNKRNVLQRVTGVQNVGRQIFHQLNKVAKALSLSESLMKCCDGVAAGSLCLCAVQEKKRAVLSLGRCTRRGDHKR
jgi:hypothetical protein